MKGNRAAYLMVCAGGFLHGRLATALLRPCDYWIAVGLMGMSVAIAALGVGYLVRASFPERREGKP